MEKLNRREKERDTSSEGGECKRQRNAERERERDCQSHHSSFCVFQQADCVSVSCEAKLKSDSVGHDNPCSNGKKVFFLQQIVFSVYVLYIWKFSH